MKFNKRSINLVITDTPERSSRASGETPDGETSSTDTLEFSVSSDSPYLRNYGYEELDHSEQAVDLSRFNNGANVLFNHDRDQYIGIIEKAWLEEGKLYNRIRFDDHDFAQKIKKSVINGVIRNVSVGYTVEELKLVGTKDEIKVYRATKWTPLETSIVTVPADATVGIGREQNWEYSDYSEKQSLIIMDKELDPLKAERERSEAVFAAGEKYNCPDLAKQALTEGWTIAELRSQILEKGIKQKPVAGLPDNLGLNQTEQKQYSFQNAIKAALNKGFSENCLEKEIHEDLVKKAKKSRGYEDNGNVLIPINDLNVDYRAARRGAEEINKRDLMVGNPILGGNLVETELLSERFIDIFRNRSILGQMGMQRITGLTGNIDIPKQVSGAVDGNFVYWIPEDADVGQIDSGFGLVKFRPKNVGSYMYVTRSMLVHSSIGIDNFIRRELAIALALGLDKAGIEGTGTNDEPLGILNTPGVNSVIFGINGDFPSWERLVQFETLVAVANADERTMGWVINAKLRGELKSRQKFAGTTGETLWQNAMAASNEGYVNGYRVGVSNQIRGNYTKGTGTNLSAAIFGDFSRLVCAEWGEYELAADPYHKFLAGGVRVRIIKTCDMAVLQEKAFSVATDIATPFSNAA